MKSEKSLISFSKDWNSSKFQTILDSICKLTKLTDEGLVSWTDWSVDIYFSLAYESFAKSDLIPDRELQAIVRRAILDVRKAKKLNVSNVLFAARQKANEFISKPFVKYSTVMDIDISLPITFNSKKFSFRGVSLEVVRNCPKYIRLYVGDEIARSPFGVAPERRYSYLIARCRARSEFEAASKAFEACAAFLGVVNLATKRWNLMGSQQRPQCLVSQGPYHFVFENGKPTPTQWFNPEFRAQFWNSSNHEGELFIRSSQNVNSILKKLNAHPLRELLCKVITAMNDGISSHQLSDRMTHYWNAIERLFSEDFEKTSYEKIIRRATFLEPDQSEARLFLGHLVEMRNRKIHHGKTFDHQHQLLEYTFELVRQFVFYLILNGDDLTSHSEFIEMADLPGNRQVLNRRILAIERRIRFMEFRRHR